MKAKEIILWALVPVVSFLSIFITISVCGALLLLLLQIKIDIPLEMHEPIYGVVSAFVFVVTGAYIAPHHKWDTALVLFAFGVYLSWGIFGAAGEYLTLFVTVSSGLIGVAFVYFRLKHNNALKPTQ